MSSPAPLEPTPAAPWIALPTSDSPASVNPTTSVDSADDDDSAMTVGRPSDVNAPDDSGSSRRHRRTARKSRDASRSRRAPIDSSSVVSIPNEVRTLSAQASDRYETVGELGRGSWGVVWHAIDRQLHRPVAIKQIVPSREVTETVRDRFLHEAKITSQLQHPGIVPVHELGDGESGQAYYVMKLLDGSSFRTLIRQTHAQIELCQQTASRGYVWRRGGSRADRLRRAILPLLERYIDVCQAIAYAHGRGIVHRDLKPANVMVGQFGETIVVDWGLAKRIGDAVVRDEAAMSTQLAQIERLLNETSQSDFTNAGSIIGTPVYMSPEQASGASTTEAADIYSLGVMLYELIVGHHPFVGCNVTTTLERVRSGDWTPAKKVRNEVPRPLSAICDRALAFKAADRYGSASELADEVRRYIAGEAVEADRENLFDIATRWCRRHRLVVITLAGAMMVLLIAATIFGVVLHHAHQSERQARMETESAHAETMGLLSQSRTTADTWLIDLSGSLEFYPGLEPIREQLISQAITHYQTLLIEERNNLSEAVAGPHAKKLKAQRQLEIAKLQLRLGDLERLSQRYKRALDHYDEASKSLTRLVATQVIDRDVADDICLQTLNVTIGRLLLGASSIADAQAFVPSLNGWLRSRGISINACLPNADGETSSAASDLVARWMSAAARLHLAIARHQEANDLADRAISSLREASAWARLLAVKRGSVSDHRLAETATTELGLALQQRGEATSASQVWQVLVDDLKQQLASEPRRMDVQQSLALARLRLADQLVHCQSTDIGVVKSQYSAAIEDLHQAWSRSDSDGFYRLNLATAENNLGLILAAGDSVDQRLAIPHLQRSLAIDREMLRSNRDETTLRRFSETSYELAKLLTANEPKRAVDLLEESNLGYQILSDHNSLSFRDRGTWDAVKSLQAQVTVAAP